MPSLPSPGKSLTEGDIEKLLFRYLDLGQDAKEASESKKELYSRVRKVNLPDLPLKVNGIYVDKEVDVDFVTEYNKYDSIEANTETERRDIYNNLYNWRYPRKDESFDCWVKAGKFHFRFEITKNELDIRMT